MFLKNIFGYYNGQCNKEGEAHGEGTFDDLTGELNRGNFKNDKLVGDMKLCAYDKLNIHTSGNIGV